MATLFPISELMTLALFAASLMWVAARIGAGDAHRTSPAHQDADGHELARTVMQASRRVDETTAGFPSTAVC